MPKSKRDKKISLTKVSKKGLALKQRLIEDLQGSVRKYDSIYLFTSENMRNKALKEVRKEWHPSRIVIGKNKVIAVALGRSEEDEQENDLHKLSNVIKGQCGLLLTNCTKQEVVDWFENYAFDDYARTGFKTETTVELKEGPLKEFSHTQEPYLRKLGMPVKLERGVVTLTQDYEVCRTGQVLTPSQAKILELLDRRLATFKLILKAHWNKKTGLEKFIENDSEEGDDTEDADQKMDTDEEENDESDNE